MNNPAVFSVLADLILVVHFLFVAFVVLVFAAIALGRFRHWQWIYSKRLRALHILAIGIVVLQAWLGKLCPLTRWEQALRIRAGQEPYTESFIQHWLHQLLFFDAELWVFAVVYSLFGAAVALFWFVDRQRLN